MRLLCVPTRSIFTANVTTLVLRNSTIPPNGDWCKQKHISRCVVARELKLDKPSISNATIIRMRSKGTWVLFSGNVCTGLQKIPGNGNSVLSKAPNITMIVRSPQWPSKLEKSSTPKKDEICYPLVTSSVCHNNIIPEPGRFEEVKYEERLTRPHHQDGITSRDGDVTYLDNIPSEDNRPGSHLQQHRWTQTAVNISEWNQSSPPEAIESLLIPSSSNFPRILFLILHNALNGTILI